MLYSIKRNKLNCAESGPSGMEFPNKWWTNEPMAPSASFNISYLHFDLYAKIFVSGLWHGGAVCIEVFHGHGDNIILVNYKLSLMLLLFQDIFIIEWATWILLDILILWKSHGDTWHVTDDRNRIFIDDRRTNERMTSLILHHTYMKSTCELIWIENSNEQQLAIKPAGRDHLFGESCFS